MRPVPFGEKKSALVLYFSPNAPVRIRRKQKCACPFWNRRMRPLPFREKKSALAFFGNAESALLAPCLFRTQARGLFRDRKGARCPFGFQLHWNCCRSKLGAGHRHAGRHSDSHGRTCVRVCAAYTHTLLHGLSPARARYRQGRLSSQGTLRVSPVRWELLVETRTRTAARPPAPQRATPHRRARAHPADARARSQHNGDAPAAPCTAPD